MPERVHTYRQNEHTVVLRPRDSRVARVQENGLNLAHFAPARMGSVPYVRPVPRHGYGPPPRAEPQLGSAQDSGYERGGDLLVRFGIDSMFGRVVARVLMCFLLLQPVYVAFGAELGESETQESGITNYEDDGGTSVDVGDGLETIEDEGNLSNIESGDGLENQELGIMNSEDDGTTSDENELAADNLQGAGEVDDGVPHPNPPLEGEGADDATSDDETANSDDTTNSELPTADSGVDGNGDGEYPLPTSPYEGEEATDDHDDTPHPNPLPEGEGVDDETTNSELPSTDSGDAANSQLPTANSEDDATTTDEVVLEEDVPDTTVASETNAGNKYTFGEGDCTLVADGEFYCVAPTVQRYASGDPRVYAEKDREGDREIYYFDGVEIHRITNNSYDDFAPVFDDTTLRIAWQASIHDRMQIMVHELETNTTRQVTNARENSSNPHLLGDSLVWQQWVDTNWEVMMTDVDTTEEFEIERLTDNAVHDMFPQLYQGLITWQREKGASWEVIVYDLRTGLEHALEKSGDTKYENPRFVLMFDSTHENGDVETIGYDIETGEMMELGTRANPQPLEPITPKDEVPDAPVQTASSTLVKVKEGGEE